MKEVIWFCDVSSSQGLSYPAHIHLHISPKTHDPLKLMVCVCKAYTSVVIYMDFKDNRSEPQKQAYWYHSFDIRQLKY